MGKILECGAFSAEPFAMDVMLGTVHEDPFVLEPGSLGRRASVKSVAAHSLYERENPFIQGGPGHELDLSGCSFVGRRRAPGPGARGTRPADGGLLGQARRGAAAWVIRSVSIAGVRCPTMIARIGDLLEEARAGALEYYGREDPKITFHVYGRDGVMQKREPAEELASDGTRPGDRRRGGRSGDSRTGPATRSAARCCTGTIPASINTSGNLAFPYSPSELDAAQFTSSRAYHLMKAASPTELFPLYIEEL